MVYYGHFNTFTLTYLFNKEITRGYIWRNDRKNWGNYFSVHHALPLRNPDSLPLTSLCLSVRQLITSSTADPTLRFQSILFKHLVQATNFVFKVGT